MGLGTTLDSTCGFQGDDNTYGLGIRVGIYLQWVISAIAYTFLPEEAATMRGVNLCFTLSNFAGEVHSLHPALRVHGGTNDAAGLLYITFLRGSGQPSGALYAVECWIVLSFCLGGVCTGAESTFGSYKASSIGGMVQFTMSGAMLYYTIWYLYVGMDTMAAPPCSRSAFFFAKVDLFHWFRTLLKVIFTISIPFYSVVLIGNILYFITSKKRLAALFSSALSTDPRDYPFNFTFSFAMVFFIISTELIIKWNHIEGVNTIQGTGQILPVVVAAASLVRVVWKLMLLIPCYTDGEASELELESHVDA